jgi:hypothetical protein
MNQYFLVPGSIPYVVQNNIEATETNIWYSDNHSDVSFCEIHHCLSNGGNTGGMVSFSCPLPDVALTHSNNYSDGSKIAIPMTSTPTSSSRRTTSKKIALCLSYGPTTSMVPSGRSSLGHRRHPSSGRMVLWTTPGMLGSRVALASSSFRSNPRSTRKPRSLTFG